jgi:hypothetical protein
MEDFTRLSPVFLLSTIVMISSRYGVRLVDGDLWLKLLLVPRVNTGDGAVGILQQNLVANDIQHHKTATRLVVVDAPDERSLIGMLFHIHIDVPLLLRGNSEPRALVTVLFEHTGTVSSERPCFKTFAAYINLSRSPNMGVGSGSDSAPRWKIPGESSESKLW